MTTTLEQARGIVRAVSPQQTGDGGGILAAPGGDGATGPHTYPGVPGGPTLPQYTEGRPDLPPGSLYKDPNSGLWQYWNGTAFSMAPEWVQQASGAVSGGGGSGMQVKQVGDKIYVFDPNTGQFVDSGLSDPTGNDGVGWGNLAQRKIEFAASEDQRAIDNANWLKQFGLAQTTANRGELGQRAGVGLSTGNLALDMARRSDQLANDPGNFPAWLQALQGNTGAGPSVQNLVGQGVTITPDENNYLNDPRFKTLLDSLFNYGTVPDAGLVDQTQQAYNTNPDAASTFFSQTPENLKRMFGTPMATGGSFTTKGPMTFRDLASGKNVATAGEAGPEQVTVTPQAQPQAQTNTTGQQMIDAWRAYHPGQSDPVPGYGISPAQGDFRALANAIRAGGYSGFPRDVLARMEQGFLPNPGDVPDWVLKQLLPSLRAMLGAGATAQLGGTGAADWNATRALYEPRGFTGAGGINR